MFNNRCFAGLVLFYLQMTVFISIFFISCSTLLRTQKTFFSLYKSLSFCAIQTSIKLVHRTPVCLFYIQITKNLLARERDSHLLCTASSHSEGRPSTSSGSCASQSETPQRKTGPFDSCHFQLWLSADPCHSWFLQRRVKLG